MMSFDLFVGCFTNGESSRFARALLDAPFEPYVIRRELGCLTVRFGDEGECYVFRGDGNDIDGFNIHRPVNSPTLYETLFAVLGSANLVLYMPDECPPLIVNAGVAAHVPAGMIDALGQPLVLKAPGEILGRILNS
jgi:hypothetical protein